MTFLHLLSSLQRRDATHPTARTATPRDGKIFLSQEIFLESQIFFSVVFLGLNPQHKRLAGVLSNIGGV